MVPTPVQKPKVEPKRQSEEMRMTGNAPALYEIEIDPESESEENKSEEKESEDSRY
jgi:hypothetical protein